MIRFIFLFLLACALAFPVQAQDSETNHCQDAESWKEWEEKYGQGTSRSY